MGVFDGAIGAIQERLTSLNGTASPFAKNPFGDNGSPFGNPLGSGGSPFNNPFGSGVGSPFSNPLGNSGGSPFSSPFGSFAIATPFRPTDSDPFGTGVSKSPVKPTSSSPNYGGFTGTSTGQADADTYKWRSLIEEAAAANGISDPDVIQAIMMLESGGNPNARSVQGAMGLMQVMPFHFGDPSTGMDPRTNVMMGAKILADNYRHYGNWDSAAAAYLGAVDANGRPTTATDKLGTSGQAYVARFQANLAKLKSTGVRNVPAAGGTTKGIAAAWGGYGNPTVTQEFGKTDFSDGNPIYDYGKEFGTSGHTGLDIGLNDGSRLFAPVGGTVIIAGGSGYYKDESGARNPATSGEIRIRLDNGDEVILGHTSQVSVKVGQRVNAGTFLGLSGTANGPHLHLEYRRKTPGATGSGYTIVDPRTMLR